MSKRSEVEDMLTVLQINHLVDRVGNWRALLRAAERMAGTMRGGRCFPKECPQCKALKSWDRARRRILGDE
jgi:hypothetical protein